MPTFRLELDPLSAKHGWMNAWLVVDDQRHPLEATSVFPPFGDLLTFARAVATHHLPHEFFWEEEGHGLIFRALPVSPESENFHLYINHDGVSVVDADFDRMQLALGLVDALREMALLCPGAKSEWEFPYFLIESFENDLAHGFAPPPGPAVSTANFVFGHYGGYGGQSVPAFTIWVDTREVLYMFMEDRAILWQTWFELLEKILHGAFPLEVLFPRDEQEDEESWTPFILRDITFCFRAQALPNPRLCQLQIQSTYPHPEPERQAQLLDAVFDRHQWVSAFVQAFQDFLALDYAAFLEGEETRFDLSTLPLDRLRAA